MKFNLLFLLLAACLISFTACQNNTESPVDLTQLKSEIQAMNNTWAEAVNTKNLDALMALFTEDAVSMPNGGAILSGKAAIRKYQEEELAATPEGMTFSYETMEVLPHDNNSVTELGTTTLKAADGTVVYTGKYWCVWVKQDGKYLCSREIYNNDAPSAPAADRSIHLFDLPADVTEAEWLAALNEMNSAIAGLGYPGAGYYLYKTENADAKNYRYYFEGVWPSADAYTKIHEDPAFIAASEKTGPMYDKIKSVEIYRRMRRVQ